MCHYICSGSSITFFSILFVMHLVSYDTVRYNLKYPAYSIVYALLKDSWCTLLFKTISILQYGQMRNIKLFHFKDTRVS